jgi:hypothetical protein
MTSFGTYKRIKINWWIILPLAGMYIWMIFAYIYQWGDKPIDKDSFIAVTVIWVVILVWIGRFKVIINNNFAIFRSDVWTPVKIPINRIEKVIAKKTPMVTTIPLKKIFRVYYFNYTAQAVFIQLKNGKTYRIYIKNAGEIKEEIEKRIRNEP